MGISEQRLGVLLCTQAAAAAELMQWLGELDAQVSVAETIDAALSRLGSDPPDIIILSPYDEIYLQRLVAACAVPILVVDSATAVGTAVRAMRDGAHGYLAPGRALVSAVRDIAVVQKPEFVRPRWSQHERAIFNRIVNRSNAMNVVISRIRAVANTPNTTALILGESGTGKELIAGAIHALSSRADKPFIPVDCGAIPPTLIESELFGHERGAFSGATSDRLGRFELANGGTIFFDEIGELPVAMQAKLLRALEERQIWRVGGSAPRKIDVRVVAATNRNLHEMVDTQAFRSDLYFRLSVFVIEVPALRARGADVLHLADHFVEHFNRELTRNIKGLSPAAKAKLVAYGFPGNVRELKNAIEEAAVAATSDQLEASDIKITLTGPAHESEAPPASDSIPFQFGANALVQLEHEAIRRAIVAAEGNKTKAAELLGINRLVLTRALVRHKIDYKKS